MIPSAGMTREKCNKRGRAAILLSFQLGARRRLVTGVAAAGQDGGRAGQAASQGCLPASGSSTGAARGQGGKLAKVLTNIGGVAWRGAAPPAATSEERGWLGSSGVLR